tara:strand:+ start:7771 stop:8637 length:867 start_codon:yes stop_codon:yes gene_type:complete
MNSKYPIYIVSKGRWETRFTSKALDSMNQPYYMVIEPEEYEEYAKVINPEQILLLPQKYHDEYDPCTEEEWKSNGPGAARNFAWEHSIENGFARHWVMDDNIRSFKRLNGNRALDCHTGAIFRMAEDFVDRYTNVALAGPQYDMFVIFKDDNPAFILNTRIYSCLLINNELPYRWRGRYNEDTDISLRALKDGWCTVEFYIFMQQKIVTQGLKGGNTDAFYADEGTMNKSRMIQKMHPDVSRVVWKFHRWHHEVNYQSFKKNRLILRDDIEIPDGVNNYGMTIKEKIT